MTLILAIAPPLLIAYYIYKKDKYDIEPRKLIIKSFLFGCLSIIPAIILELIFNESLFPNLFIYVMIGIALIEEGLKYFFLKRYLYNKDDFNEPMDGIVYAVMISMGFALVENVGYVYSNQGIEIQVAIMRMFTAIPLHAACGIIMGYYVGMAKFNDNKELLLMKGLGLATLIHGLYDYFLFLGEGIILSIIALLIGIYYAKRAIKLHQQDSKSRNI
jgi:protease PrsW